MKYSVRFNIYTLFAQYLGFISPWSLEIQRMMDSSFYHQYQYAWDVIMLCWDYHSISYYWMNVKLGIFFKQHHHYISPLSLSLPPFSHSKETKYIFIFIIHPRRSSLSNTNTYVIIIELSHFSTLVYVKLLFLWILVLAADYLLEFRFVIRNLTPNDYFDISVP